MSHYARKISGVNIDQSFNSNNFEDDEQSENDHLDTLDQYENNPQGELMSSINSEQNSKKENYNYLQGESVSSINSEQKSK